MLALAIPSRFGAGEDERIALRQIGSRAWAHRRLFELGKRRVAVAQERFGVELDLARRRLEARIDVLSITGCERNAHASGLGAQTFERHAARLELMPIGCVDVAVPEVVPEAEAG